MDSYTLLEKGVTPRGPIPIEAADVEHTHNLSVSKSWVLVSICHSYACSKYENVIRC